MAASDWVAAATRPLRETEWGAGGGPMPRTSSLEGSRVAFCRQFAFWAEKLVEYCSPLFAMFPIPHTLTSHLRRQALLLCAALVASGGVHAADPPGSSAAAPYKLRVVGGRKRALAPRLLQHLPVRLLCSCVKLQVLQQYIKLTHYYSACCSSSQRYRVRRVIPNISAACCLLPLVCCST